MTKFSTYSFISGILFWIPILGILFSGFALIFGIFSLKRREHEENKSLAITGTILGSIGIVFSSIGITFIGLVYPNLILFMQEFGIMDTLWPIYSLTISFTLLIYAILNLKNIENMKKALISLCSGFLLSVLLSLPHILGLYPTPGSDVVNVLNTALPNLSIISLLLIFSLVSTIFIAKKRFFYAILLFVIVLLFIMMKPYSDISWFMVWLSILLYSLPLIFVLYQHRDLLKAIHKKYYVIAAVISLSIVMALIVLAVCPRTDAYMAFIYQHHILLVLLDISNRNIIFAFGAIGIILWILSLVKISKSETAI